MLQSYAVNKQFMLILRHHVKYLLHFSIDMLNAASEIKKLYIII